MPARVRLVLLFLALAPVPPLGAGGLPPVLVITGARILDAEGRGYLEDHDVFVIAERIARIGRSGELPLPEAVTRLDLRGYTLLPGLIDLHSHLLLHPYNEATWEDQVLKEPLELRTIRAVVAARTTVEAGFTTLRDLGTEGAGFADVALRDAIAREIIPGPWVFATTRAIVASGCYGPSGFDPRWNVPKGAQEADGVDGVRKAVRQQIAAGADWIKVYADYRRREGDLATPTFSQEELNALVDEAGSAGLPVAAHATTPEAMRRCALAGVATIEHGFGATEEVLEVMRDRGVVLCPTLTALEAVARYAGWKPGMPDDPRVAESKVMFARALASGVTIACGSDVGVFAHGENVRELELMVEYGMSPEQAIRAATRVAAKVLRREHHLGRIAEGLVADLIAVRGDPLQHISVLRRPPVVIKGGAIIVDRR